MVTDLPLASRRLLASPVGDSSSSEDDVKPSSTADPAESLGPPLRVSVLFPFSLRSFLFPSLESVSMRVVFADVGVVSPANAPYPPDSEAAPSAAPEPSGVLGSPPELVAIGGLVGCALCSSGCQTVCCCCRVAVLPKPEGGGRGS